MSLPAIGNLGTLEVTKIESPEFKGSCNFCSDKGNAAYEIRGKSVVVRACLTCAQTIAEKLPRRKK